MSILKIMAPAGAIMLLCGWLVLKDAAAMALYGAPASAAASADASAPDYSEDAAWIIRPEAPPASVWEGEWDVDLFLLSPWPKAWMPPGEIDPANADYRVKQADCVDDLLPVLEAAGPVYAPAVRLPSPAVYEADWALAQADTMAALKTYFEVDNRGRAVVFVAPEGSKPLVDRVLAQLDTLGELERARTVGLVILFDGEMAETSVPCDFGPQCPIQLDVGTSQALMSRLAPQPAGGIHPLEAFDAASLSQDLATLKETWLAHLEAGVPKPAEPLGDFETIEVAPIHTADGDPVED